MKKIVHRITGKTWSPEYGDDAWLQDAKKVYTPKGDEEGLLHEVLHWVVASAAERTLPNLGLDAEDGVDPDSGMSGLCPDRRESQVAYLTWKIFALREWELPRSLVTSARRYPLSPEEEREADDRLAASGTSVEELASAMSSPVSYFNGLNK